MLHSFSALTVLLFHFLFSANTCKPLSSDIATLIVHHLYVVLANEALRFGRFIRLLWPRS